MFTIAKKKSNTFSYLKRSNYEMLVFFLLQIQFNLWQTLVILVSAL